MLRMKNKTGEVGDLSDAMSNRIPEEERLQQKYGCKSRPSRSMLRMNNSSLEIGGGGGGGMGRKKTGVNAVVQDNGN